jgi:hypothetical protein
VLLGCVPEKQDTRDWPSPKEARENASEIDKARTGLGMCLGTHWRSHFCKRKDTILSVGVWASQEEVRNAVQFENVVAYFSQVIRIQERYRTPGQILNIPESGVTVRWLQGKRKHVALLTNSSTAPRSCDVKDVSHILVVGPVSLASGSLLPLLLTVSLVPFRRPGWNRLCGDVAISPSYTRASVDHLSIAVLIMTKQLLMICRLFGF